MTPAAPASPLRHAWWVLAVVAVAVAPHVGSLGAPWISDDAAALAYVHREGAWADWGGAEYGMRIVRFWRPLVTTTLGLQEDLSGLSPAPLRAFNLAGHVLAALLAGALALRLGGGRLGALASGVLAGGFPDAGGTVTWLVGRVDAQTVPLVLGAAWLGLRPGRPAAAAAAALAFLACASKELGFVTPLVGAALAWGAGAGARGAARAAVPLALGAGAALLARRLALGAWVGGYPAPPLGPAELAAAARAAAAALAGPLALAAGLAALAWLAARAGADAAPGPGEGTPRATPRAAVAALAAAGLALAPLLPLLSDGVLEAQNRRVLFLADALLAVAAGVALGPLAALRSAGAARRGARVAGALAVLAVLALGVVRVRDARSDVREWVAAAHLADAHVARTRATLAGEPPSDLPVLDGTLPRVYGGAYCLALGAADRFRAPFEATPRPVWPLRLMFALGGAERERRYVTRPRANLVWPFGGAQRMVPEMPVTIGGRRVEAPLVLDEDVARGGGPELELWGAYPDARLEALVYTELGYETGLLGPAVPDGLEPDPFGAAGARAPVVRRTLGTILRATEVASLGEALLQAADVGATRAYLELRVVDDAKGIRNRPIAASRMIPLEWPADLPARLAAPAGG